MKPSRPTSAFLLVAFAIVVWRLIAGDAPLSVLLLAAFPLGLALIPARDRGWRPLVALIAFGAALPLLTSRGLSDPRSVLPWWPLLVKAWAMAGVVLVLAGLGARARSLPWPARVPAWLGVAILALIAVSILPKLYYHQLRLRAERWAEPGFVGAVDETITTRDGVRLQLTVLPGRTDAGTLILTHGVGGYPQQFLGMTLFMRQRGWTVVHWDLRGHGRSSPAAVTYGLREADDLVAVWDHVRATRGNGQPMVVYGGSLGAATVLLAADRLTGCAGVMAESSFAEFAPLIVGNLHPAAATVARTIAGLGLGLVPEALRPVDAAILRAGPPLVLAASALDPVVAAWHHRDLVAAAPRATTLVNPDGYHLDAIYAPAWRDTVLAWLTEAEAYHRAHDGLGAFSTAR